MLCWISIVGGLLIMMGQHDRSEALFYYFRLEDQVPETHLLRLIDKHISFAFVREKLKDSYSDTGRPSIDPELLLRMPYAAAFLMRMPVLARAGLYAILQASPMLPELGPPAPPVTPAAAWRAQLGF